MCGGYLVEVCFDYRWKISLVTKCNNIISQKIFPCVNGGITSDKIDTYGGF